MKKRGPIEEHVYYFDAENDVYRRGKPDGIWDSTYKLDDIVREAYRTSDVKNCDILITVKSVPKRKIEESHVLIQLGIRLIDLQFHPDYQE